MGRRHLFDYNKQFSIYSLLCGLFSVVYLQAVQNGPKPDGEGTINDPAVIKVSTKHGNDSINCLKNSSVYCKTISYALKNGNLNSTQVLLAKNEKYALNETIKIEFVFGLKIASEAENVHFEQERPSIMCGATNAGLVFTQCQNISLADFNLKLCGSDFTTTSRNKRSLINASTALLMTDSKNINFKRVAISSSAGIGAVFYDVVGTVRFEYVTFDRNIVPMAPVTSDYHRFHFAHSSYEQLETGGGIYIEFRPFKKWQYTNSSSWYSFNVCSFRHNNANYLTNRVISESIGKRFFSLGRGGGISFISRGTRQGNHLIIDSCLFHGNQALWGAGIFAEFDDESGTNSIKVSNSDFRGNHAEMAGGGVRIGINSDNEMGYNTVVIKGSNFTKNSAKIGGAFSQYRSSETGRDHEYILIEGCRFEGNSAFLASTVHVQNVNATLINARIINENNRMMLGNSLKQGALYCFSSHVILKGDTFVSGSHFTAFILDYCLLMIFGKANFTHNRGINGGAMTLYGHSKVRLTEGSMLTFHCNRAQKKGGAIYVETAIPTLTRFNSTELNVYKCFFVFGNSNSDYHSAKNFNTSIEFIGNKAPKILGKNIWATTISWCRGENEQNFNNTALKWSIMHNLTEDSVRTSPYSIEVNEEEWNAYPGISTDARVTLRDENWNIVQGTLRITLKSENDAITTTKDSELDVIKDGIAKITFTGPVNTKFDVLLETLDRYSVQKIMFNRTLRDCPPGFQYCKHAMVCQCLGIDAGVTHCNPENRKVYIIPNRWGNPWGTKEFAENVCPSHYCNRSDAINDTANNGRLFNKNTQCAEGRNQMSTLCSQCKEDYSVILGAETCEPCKDNRSGLWMLLFLVLLTILVLAVMLVNVDTYSTYLNGFFYSYQIIPLLIENKLQLDYFISFLMSISNFSGFGKIQKGVCVFDRMTNMDKLLLNYLAPVYLVVSTVIIGALSRYFKRCIFSRKSTFRAFVFISVIAYADFTKLTVKILRPVKINGTYYAYYAAYMPYFGQEHARYAGTAVAVLVLIVLGFPLVLMFPNYITRYPKFVKLSGIFDTFREPFKDGPYYNMFAVYYFTNRLVLLSLDLAVESKPLHDCCFCIASVVILMIFIICQPYKETKMNIVDGLQLTNLTFMTFFYTAVSLAYESKVRHSLEKVNHALAYIPFLCVAYGATMWLMKKIKQYQEKRRNGELR